MTITPIDNPNLLSRDVRTWRGFAGKTQAAAAAKLRRLFLQHRAGCKSTPPCTQPARAAEYDSDREEPQV